MKASDDAWKFRPSFVPPILYRTRLLRLLEKNRNKKLTLILGQAAQGKTSLAAFYAANSNVPSGWINLDKEDSSPFQLLSSIAESLHRVFPELDFSHLHFVYPQEAIEKSREFLLFREWTQSLFRFISFPVQIFLDGLDRLSPNASSFKLLQVLIQETPPKAHWTLISRGTPPLLFEFQHLQIKQQAWMLGNEELAFTPAEIAKFFKKLWRISLDKRQINKIHSATEGWLGGLILLAECLNRSSDSSGQKGFFEAIPDRFRKATFQYFAREIFYSQPKEVQDLLVKSSILNILEPRFLNALIGIETSGEILQGFSDKHLFVHSIFDQEKGWFFRYHELFKDFLKARFREMVKKEVRQSLLSMAGELYAKRGELESAVKYFLEAGEFLRACPLIERLGMDLLRFGKEGQLAKLLLALPEKALQENPRLSFFLTVTRRSMAGKENVMALHRAYAFFKEKGDLKGVLTSLAYLIEVSIHTGFHLVPIRKLIEEGETHLKNAGLNGNAHERAMLWYFLGLSHILGEGDVRKGIWACENAYLISRQLKDVRLQAYALIFSALGKVFVGEFSLANQACLEVEKLTEERFQPELRAIVFMISSILANHEGDFPRAQVTVEKLMREIEKFGFLSMFPWVYEVSGYLRLSRREFAEAEEAGSQYLKTAATLKNSFFKGLGCRLMALIFFHQEDYKKAKSFADRSIEAFTVEARSVFETHKTEVLQGLISGYLGDYQDAEKMLGTALKYFKALQSYNFTAETHLAMALLKARQGKLKQALSHLEIGFQIAEEKKYEHFFFLGSKYLSQACLLTLELKAAGSVNYAVHLFATRLSSQAENGLRKLENDHPDSGIREKARKIRRSIHRMKVPPLRIETLGSFRVFRGDSLIQEEEWDRNQPRRLLKAILSHGPEVPKEVLMEDLWPEEKSDRAEKNFKTTLQRLRKSLEPGISKEFNSSYIHLHDNSVLLDQELCRVDAECFLSLLKKGAEEEKKGEIKCALSSYTEALEMFKGEFLPEELYAPFVDTRREELKERYKEVLTRAARLYAMKGSSTKTIECYRKLIQADPLVEEFYQNLMSLYFDKGMITEALKTYERCKKILETEIHSRPDLLTTSLYKKILEKAKSTVEPPPLSPGFQKV